MKTIRTEMGSMGVSWEEPSLQPGGDTLIVNGQKIVIPDGVPMESRVTYLPFAGAYLLEGRHYPYWAAAPMWLLFPNGILQKVFDPPGKNMWQLSYLRPLQVFTKRGVIFGKRKYTGEELRDSGLYSWRDDTLTPLVAGAFEAGAISPDGCRLAVINNKLKNQLRFEERYRIQVFDLCHGASERIVP